MRSLALLALFASATALAQDNVSPALKRQFCEERLSSKDSLQKLVSQSKHQLAMQNQGGLFGGGVCWWHSRFTRAAAYLAIFDPSQPRPSEEEAKRIITQIRKRKGIIVVPGFQNLYEFSRVYSRDIIDKLADWQRSDGIFKFSWYNGLTRDEHVSAETFEKKMDETYEKIQNGEIVYQMLQMPGIVAHSWLVIGMDKTFNGYKLRVIDSNFPGTVETYNYLKGMDHFNYYNQASFVPYIGQGGEERKLKSKLVRTCQDYVNVDQQDESESESDNDNDNQPRS